MFDPFTWIVVLLPLGSYFLVVGWCNGSRRPLVVSGARDQFTLGLGCIGLFLAGPFSLFFPQSAFNLLGGWVWLVLVLLYLLLLSLVIMGQRPRLIIYSSDSSQVVQQVRLILNQMDPNTSWAGTSFHSPLLQIAGNVDSRNGEPTAQVIATNRQQNLTNWINLHRSLSTQLNATTPQPSRVNGWVVLGLAVFLLVSGLVFAQPNETLAAMREILRF